MTTRGAPSFHAFTTKAPGRAHRILTPVALSVAFDPNSPPTPFPPQVQVDALWDTGATGSMVVPSTAAALGIQPIGRVNMRHAGGQGETNTYLVNITLPNHVGIAGVRVCECQDAGGEFGAIIGMDVITRGDLAISNLTGQTWMTFRIPSVEAVDFVKEANHLMYAGTPRNAPCPCGATDAGGHTIKFKHCHGA